MKNNHGFSNILIVLTLILVVGGGYLGYKNYYKPKIQEVPKSNPVTPQTVTKKTIPTDQEIIESIRSDLALDKNEMIILREGSYTLTDKYEVVDAGYQFSMHLVYRPIAGGKWKSDYSAQNSFECKELDKLGFTRTQTIEWKCFEYDKQIYRK